MSDNDTSVDKPLVENKMPVYRGGRLKGQLNTYSKDGMRRLAQLGYDPMEEMVKLSKDIDKELWKVTHNSDKTLKDRYSAVAYSNLLATKQKLINDLLRYGYSRVPETEALKQNEIKPVVINLSKKGDAYIPTENYEDVEYVDHIDMDMDDSDFSSSELETSDKLD